MQMFYPFFHPLVSVFIFLELKYEYVSHHKSWQEAENYCKSINGHLASITSHTINDDLYRRLQDKLVHYSKSNAYSEIIKNWVSFLW